MTPVYYFEIEQRSAEWYERRKGKFTGTDASMLLVNGKNPNGLGAGVITALYEKCAELIADYLPQSFDTFAMQQGREREPDAIEAYEERIFPEMVTACGFVELGNYCGVSPDGLVGKDGGIEVKCLQPPAYLEYIIDRTIDTKHLAQIQWSMFITGRKWWDYIVYNPDFGAYPMDVQRIERNEEMMQVFETKSKAISDAMETILSAYEKLDNKI